MLNPGLHSKAFEYLNRLQADSPRLTKRNYEEKMLAILRYPEEEWEEGARQNGILFSPEVHNILKMLKEEGVADSAADYKDRLPLLQSIIDFSIMENAKNDFDRIIKERFTNSESYKVSDKIFFGTMNSRVTTASIRKVPESDEFLIVINRQLWETAKFLTYVLTVVLFDENGGWRGFNPENAEPYLRYFLRNTAAVLNGEEVQEETIPLELEKNSPREQIWLMLDEALHDFILGHEYGHFLHSHFADDNAGKTETAGETDTKDNVTSWKNEYEADRTGLDLTVFRTIGDDSPEPAGLSESEQLVRFERMLMGVMGSWACLHLTWNIEQMWGTLYRPDTWHPPTPLRIASMQGAVGGQMPHKQAAAYAYERLYNIANCTGYLFSKLKPGTAANTPDAKKVEMDFQYYLLQAAGFYDHREIYADLNSIIASLNPPFPPPDRFESMKARELVLSAYRVLIYVIKQGILDWQKCKVIAANCKLILEKNAETFGAKVQGEKRE